MLRASKLTRIRAATAYIEDEDTRLLLAQRLRVIRNYSAAR
jgi:hypothetical protein